MILVNKYTSSLPIFKFDNLLRFSEVGIQHRLSHQIVSILKTDADKVLDVMRLNPLGTQAVIIGEAVAEHPFR